MTILSRIEPMTRQLDVPRPRRRPRRHQQVADPAHRRRGSAGGPACMWDASRTNCVPAGQDFALCVDLTHASWMLNHGAFSPGFTGNQKTLALAGSARLGMSCMFPMRCWWTPVSPVRSVWICRCGIQAWRRFITTGPCNWAHATATTCWSRHGPRLGSSPRSFPPRRIHSGLGARRGTAWEPARTSFSCACRIRSPTACRSVLPTIRRTPTCRAG